MASIPSNGYNEVMAGTNNYTGSNNFAGDCPQTPILATIPNDLTNKQYVDGLIGPPSGVGLSQVLTVNNNATTQNIVNVNTYDTTSPQSGGSTAFNGTYRCRALGFASDRIMELTGYGIGRPATSATSGFDIANSCPSQSIDINTTVNTDGSGLRGVCNVYCPLKPVSIKDRFNSWGTDGQVLTTRGTAPPFGSFNPTNLEWKTPTGTETLQQTLDIGNTATGANAKISLTDSGVAYTTAPTLIIGNSNATVGNTTGVPSVEFYKSGRTAATADVIMSQNIAATNYLGAKQTFGKIECVVTSNNNITGIDGAMDFYSCVNGTPSLVWRLNGNDNENNSFRPLDMNANDIKTSQGAMIITTAASSGTGTLSLLSKTGATASMSAGGALQLNANGGAVSTVGSAGIVTTALNGGINLTANNFGTIQLNTAGGAIAINSTNYSQTATTGTINIVSELHYGTMSTAYPNQIYRSVYQPVLTSATHTLPVAEFQFEGQQVCLVNSRGDGGNELLTVPTPFYTITCIEYIQIGGQGHYAAGGYNHIQNRAEIRIAPENPSGINAFDADITSGNFQYIALNTSGAVWCICYDPILLPNCLGVGGSFVATLGANYNPSGTFPSAVSGILGLDITTYAGIAPFDMSDTIGGSPTFLDYGVNGSVYCCGTRAYDNTFYPPASAPFYLFGGNFTSLVGGTGTAMLRQVCWSPTGGTLTPFGARWWNFGGANDTINMIVNDSNGKIAMGGSFTTIGASSVSFLAYTEPALLSTFAYSPFGTQPTSTVLCGKANFGFFQTTLIGGTTFNYGYDDGGNNKVEQADLNNIGAASALIKENLTSQPRGIGVNLNVATPSCNFIVGWSGTGSGNYCWDNITPQYLDLNGSDTMSFIYYQGNAPAGFFFFRYAGNANSAPLQYSLYDNTNAGIIVVSSTSALPFVNGVAPANKYTKLNLASRNSYATGSVVGFGGDDVRILITSQFGATFNP